MREPRMNHCTKHDMMVLNDPSYDAPRGHCKICGTMANLDEGLCEACFHHQKNVKGDAE